MTRHHPDSPLARLADDLAAMEADIYGIAALGRDVATLFDAEQRAARARLRATIAAATMFSTVSATSAVIGLGHSGAVALTVGILAGLAAASSVLVTWPAPGCVERTCARLGAWWRR